MGILINKALPLGRMFWCVRQFAFSRRLTLFFSVSTLRRCSLTGKTTQLVWYLFLFAPSCHERCVTINMKWWNKSKLQMFKKRLFPKLLFYISHYSGTNESREHGGTYESFPLNQFKDKHALLLIVNLKLFLRCRNEFFSINTSWNQSSDNLFTSITEKVNFLTLYLR